MQIHIVQSGDTLHKIATTYGITIDAIVSTNELPHPDRLVVGQALVIPIEGRIYIVQKGDSLWSIGQKFHISYTELASYNQIPIHFPLQIGMRLHIPPQPKVKKQTNAYVEPSGNTVSEFLRDHTTAIAPYLTYLSPFTYRVNEDGSLIAPPLQYFPKIAEVNNNVLVMVISNLKDGAFNTQLASIILNNTAIQNQFISHIIAETKRVGFGDIHFDFERIRLEDREAYNQFLRIARDRFHAEGLTISTALAPKTSANQPGEWYVGHDYKAHGEIVDYVVVMTYEWGYSGGPPMAVSPLPSVRQVLEYALTVIPAHKIMMGQNLYGYDWTLPFVQGSTARAISPQQAIEIAANHHAAIQYDTTAQAPFFHYISQDGKQHEVWFEDARSIQAKFDLMKELNLRGISYWKLGLSFPQNWLLLRDQFEIEKLRHS